MNKYDYTQSGLLLATQRYSNIANFITHEACQTFFHAYNKRQWIPTSFIEFYFEEYRRYDFLSQKILTPFFNEYNKDDLPSIVQNYHNSHYSLIKKKANKGKELCYHIANNYYLDTVLYEKNMLGSFDPILYQDLGMVSKHVRSGDELLSIKELYEYYMLKKIILTYDSSKNKLTITAPFKQDGKEKQITQAIQSPESSKLVGTPSELPDQKGKVVKLFIPKFTLPTNYPILVGQSRILSTHKASRFLKPYEQIHLINKIRLNGVKYKMDFISKRFAAKQPKRRRFEFDF